MSFGDASRYLQGGFEDGIQQELDAHISQCPNCQEEIDRVQSLMSKGKNMMSSRIHTVDDDNDSQPPGTMIHVADEVLAAYADNSLEGQDRLVVSNHLSDCHWCFSQYSAIKKELAVPVQSSLIAPFEMVEAMKKTPEIQIADKSLREEEWASLINGVNRAFDQILALRWPAPAMAFAVGVMLMVLLIPVGKTIIPLPTAGVAPDEATGGRIHSGLLDEEGQSLYGNSVVQLPAETEGPVTFSWPAIDDVEGVTYNVDVSDGDGLNFGEYKLTTNSWTIDISLFEPDRIMAMTVVAKIPGKGLQPVTTILVHRHGSGNSAK